MTMVSLVHVICEHYGMLYALYSCLAPMQNFKNQEDILLSALTPRSKREETLSKFQANKGKSCLLFEVVMKGDIKF